MDTDAPADIGTDMPTDMDTVETTDTQPADSDACGLTRCGTACIDVAVDPNHCGACGYACDQGLACVDGTCTLVCPAGRTACLGACVDLGHDDAHCGGCGTSCGAGVCRDGQCSPECGPGEIACGDACVVPTTDPQHCGACTIGCEAADVCEQGRCCSPGVNCNALPIVTLPIVTIANWRGGFALDDGNPTTVNSTATFATYLNAQRAALPELTVLATGLFGLPSRGALIRPASVTAVMDALGLALAGLTRADLQLGADTIATQIGSPNFALVAPVSDDVATELPDARAPFAVIGRLGHTVAVIDLARRGDDTLGLAADALYAHEEAEAQGADVFILLTDLETVLLPGAAKPSGELFTLAKALRGFDLIVGHATRGPVSPVVINGQVVVQNHDRGRVPALVSLVIEGAGAARDAGVVDIDAMAHAGLTADPVVDALLQDITTDTTALGSEIVATTTAPFPYSTVSVRSQETALGNLVADAVHEGCDATLGLVNAGVVRAGLPQGDISLATLLATVPFEEAIFVQTISGNELWAALENGVNTVLGTGRFPLIAGFSFRYDPAAAAGSRILEVKLADGRDVRRDANRYTVASSELIADGGDGYTMLPHVGRKPCDALVRLLLNYARAHTPLAPSTDGRLTTP